MSSKQVPDLTLAPALTGLEEFHLVAGVVRDGSGNVTNHGNSRRETITALANFVLSEVPAAEDGHYMQRSLNLSDLASPSAARHNLGLLRLIPFFFTTTPTADEILAIYACADVFTLPLNLAGSVVEKLPTLGVNPAASFALDVRKNDVSFGTITIHTDATVALVSTATTTAIGDVITVHAPHVADTAIANWALNLVGDQ